VNENVAVVCPADTIKAEGVIVTYAGELLVRLTVTAFAEAWPRVMVPVRVVPVLIVELERANVIAG
jgi:hypothetical protein